MRRQVGDERRARRPLCIVCTTAWPASTVPPVPSGKQFFSVSEFCLMGVGRAALREGGGGRVMCRGRRW
jgi:hypothetical protein